MNKVTKIIVWIVVIVLAIWVFSSGNEKSVSNESIKIGALLPLTGKLANLGEDVRNSLELTRQQIKEKDGIDLEIIYEDSAADAKIALPAAQKLINADKVQMIIGGPGSTSNLAVAPFVEKAQVPFFVLSATPQLNVAGEYIFKIIPDVNGEVLRTAKKLIDGNLKTVAFIYDSAADSNVIGRDVFVAEYEKLGGKVVLNEGYDTKTTTDFRPIFTKAKGRNPSAVYFLGTDIAAGLAVRQAREIGLKQTIFGWSAAESQQFIKGAGQASEGFVLSTFKFSCDEGDQDSVDFCLAYGKMFDSRVPVHYGAHAHDLLLVIKDVVKNTKESGQDFGQAIIKAFTSHSYEGITGKLDFDAQGNVVDKDFVYRTVKDGKFVLAK